jgi:succinate dehydrogenase / fumarate reductase cytochrome b subunit
VQIAVAEKQASLTRTHFFLIRRLHSLSGVVPIGAYLTVHLLTNASVLDTHNAPGELFQQNVDRIHSIGALLPFVEWGLIFIPLLFHALLGVAIWLGSEPNPKEYPFTANIRYTLQRTTGLIAFAFIFFHVGTLKWGIWTPFDKHDAYASTSAAIQKSWWVAPIYAIGTLCAVYHFANGVWTSLITWGVTVGRNAQRVSGYVCAAFGVALAVVGVGAIYGFRTGATSASAPQIELSVPAPDIKSSILKTDHRAELGSER